MCLSLNCECETRQHVHVSFSNSEKQPPNILYLCELNPVLPFP